MLRGTFGCVEAGCRRARLPFPAGPSDEPRDKGPSWMEGTQLDGEHTGQPPGRQIRDRMGLEGNQRLLLRGFVHPLWLSRTEQRWRPRLDIMQRNRHLRVTPFVLHPAPLLDFGGEGQF